jgi:hypothetical protein
MEAALIGALSALTGSAIGALAPFLSNVILQRSTISREFLTRRNACHGKVLRLASSTG